MNTRETVNEEQAEHRLRALLQQMDSVRDINVAHEVMSADMGIDLVVSFRRGKSRHKLLVEVKANAEPARVRNAIWQLHSAAETYGADAYTMLAAPYISPASRQICRESGIGYIDFAGNAYLSVGGLEIDHRTDVKPKTEQRVLRSLFKPKAAAVLHTMLKDPKHQWRIGDLAQQADVSAGHASQVGQQLRQREWAEQSDEGVWLSDPNALLDMWREEYEPPSGERVQLYTHLHGRELQDAVRSVMTGRTDVELLYASFSAADWIAPFARTGRTYFYADERGLARLQVRLELQSASKGANIDILIPDDPKVFQTAMLLENGLVSTDPVQTYLDLSIAGERGREAAEHLRAEALQW
ncbi:type IV toxin-antitoxin system AbiEi family antitoxin [Novosphingopyxis baekryungensis]|uniref:type IV toxin-antitoxin system AbiEi family antitoxin n=1 Tax=Novosphingopyxis baekryungensis TaxID=279369 RepID=UPI0003B4C33A|nr:type IV toxin-antitoxin system AbiEi family antitoxin [Novosphingopyxis baekryungensis]